MNRWDRNQVITLVTGLIILVAGLLGLAGYRGTAELLGAASVVGSLAVLKR